MASMAINPATNKPITDKLERAEAPVLGSINLPSFAGVRTGVAAGVLSDLFVVITGASCFGASGVVGSAGAGTNWCIWYLRVNDRDITATIRNSYLCYLGCVTRDSWCW